MFLFLSEGTFHALAWVGTPHGVELFVQENNAIEKMAEDPTLRCSVLKATVLLSTTQRPHLVHLNPALIP